ncbi:FAD-dependent oxidoreductase [Pseudonocardia ailaonensis]|uniref:FAD-dependent oxidoreductase n=1 Tax=Pseudonocardia ailaonensis TaxID=367279 RepID=A0ABN2NF62_9PSEU
MPDGGAGSARTSTRTVVIVGASVAGVRCATALRDAGHDGRIVLLDAEDETPYDKPPLSKNLAPDDGVPLLVERGVLGARGIEFHGGRPAVGLDLSRRVVETSDGVIAFDDLVIASGCRPRRLPAPLPPRATYVRTKDDWARLREAVARGGRLLVVGAGFLGLETAAAARRQGMQVTVFDVAPQVLRRGVPASAAEIIAAGHREEGVELRLGISSPTVDGDAGGAVVDGVAGDFAIVSIGAVPAVDWLAGSGLALDDGVVCDSGLRAGEGIWAIGDCARWHNARYGELRRTEHWTTATQHGRHVAGSIAAGTATPFGELPYVWSDQFGRRIQTVGVGGDEEITCRAPDGAPVVLSVRDDLVTGVTTIDAQAVCLKARLLLRDEDRRVDEVRGALGLGGLAPVR